MLTNFEVKSFIFRKDIRLFLLCLIFLVSFIHIGISQVVNLPCQTELDGFIGLDRKDWNGGSTDFHSEGSLHNFDLPTNSFGDCKKISNVTIDITIINIDISNLPPDCPPPGSYYINLTSGCPSFDPASCDVTNLIYENPNNPLNSQTLSFNSPPEIFLFGDVFGIDIVPVMDVNCTNGQSAISSGGIILDYEICVSVTIVDESIEMEPNLGLGQTICPENIVTLNPGSFSSYNWAPNGETTPTIDVGPGTYGVTVSDANGCLGTDEIVITEFPESDITFNPPDPSVCDGGTIMVSVNEMYNTYNWSNSMTGQSVLLSEGTYTVTIIDGNDCTASGSITVANVSPPNAGIDNFLDVCNDGTFYNIEELLTTYDPGGTWSDDNVSGVDVNANPSSVDFSGVVPGTYTFTYSVNGIDPCPQDEAVITIEVFDQNYAGIDNTIDYCLDPGLVNFMALLSNPDFGGFWTEITPLGLDFSDPTNINLDGIPIGSYEILYTISQNGPCAEISSLLTFNIIEGAIAGIDNEITVCEGAEVDLNTLINGANQTGVFEDTDDSNALVGSTVFTTGLAGSSFNYTYIVGSMSSQCGQDEAIYTINIETSLSAGDDTSISLCLGGDINLYDILANEDIGGTFTDINNSGGLLLNILSTDTILPGTYIYEYTIGDGIICPVDFSSVTITFQENPNYSILSKEKNICENNCDEIQINFSGTPPFNFNLQVFSSETGNQIATNTISSNDSEFRYIVCNSSDTSAFINDTLHLVNDSSWFAILPSLNDVNCDVENFLTSDTLIINTVSFSRTTIDTSSCITDTLTIGNFDFYNGNGVFQDTIPGAKCDSIININVTFTDIDTIMIQPTICSGDSILIEGVWFSEVFDNQEINVTNLNGCDSLKLISVFFFPSADTLINSTLCTGDSIVVNNTVYNEMNPSGFEVLPEASKYGCDSIIEVSLDFSNDIIIVIDDQFCSSDSIIVGDDIYDITNPQGQTILSSNACDTIVEIDLTFFDQADTLIEGIFCSDFTIMVNGNTYDINVQTGNEIIPSGSKNGCDSTIIIDLDFYSPIVTEIDTALCSSSSIVINGTIYDDSNTSGTEIFQNASSNGCDSTVFVQVSILDSYNETEIVNICEGDSVFLSGAWQFTEGTYTDIFQTTEMCDSIINTVLSVAPCMVLISSSVQNNICAGDKEGVITLDIQSDILLPYTVFWIGSNSGITGSLTISTEQETVTINDLFSDIYTLTIQNLNGDVIYQNLLEILDENTKLGGAWNVLDSIECYNESGSIEFVVTGGQSPYTYDWVPNSIGDSPFAQNITSGNYALTISDQFGCTHDTMITFTEPEDIVTTISTMDVSCANMVDGSILLSSITGGTSPYSIFIDGEGQDSNLITGLDVGIYTLDIIDANGCSLSFMEELEIMSNSSFYIEEYQINFGDSIILEGTVGSGNYTFNWSDPNSTLSCTDCQNPIASPSETTSYLLSIIDEFGCEQEIIIEIIVIEDRINNVFPNIFSPNGDNTNDEFIFRTLNGEVSSISMNIYDRWGNLIHTGQINGNEYSWDGTKSGNNLNPGVYVYKATIVYSNLSSEVIVGDVLLLK